jgi:hypothetical protein
MNAGAGPLRENGVAGGGKPAPGARRGGALFRAETFHSDRKQEFCSGPARIMEILRMINSI